MSKTGSGAVGLTRKQVSRSKRERRLQRFLWIGALVVALGVVGVIGYGLLDLYVLQPGQPIAVVNGHTITVAEFQTSARYLRYRVLRQSYLPYTSDPQFRQYFAEQIKQVEDYLNMPEYVGQQVLTEMINEELIRQEAARRQITVSAEEIESRRRQTFAYYPNGTPTPTASPVPLPTDAPPTVNPTALARLTPTPTFTPTVPPSPTPTSTPGPSPTPWPSATPYTDQAYAADVITYSTSLKKWTGMTEADLRKAIEAQIYREKLMQAITADMPVTEEQVHARHILIRVTDAMTDTEKVIAQTRINDIAAMLKAGDDFAVLAAQYSEDSSAKDGGDLGWSSQASMVPEFGAAAFNMPVGSISEPVQTQYGWHIIQVLGKGVRALPADQVEKKRETLFDEWLQKQRLAMDAAGQPVVKTYDALVAKYSPTEPEPTTFVP